MKTLHKLAFCCFCAALIACSANGPQKTLDQMADALQNNNPDKFIAEIDMKAYSANYLASLTNNNDALSALNSLSNIVGLGGLDQIINNFVDYEAILRQDLVKGVASGSLMERCKAPQQLNCPWVPQSLRNATVTLIGKDGAIAKVVSPANLTSWIALRQLNGKWVVVGQTILEQKAREYASGHVEAEGEPPASSI